jgi:hypothetical protein
LSGLILCRITDKTLCIGKGDKGWSGAITMLVRNDFHTIVLPYTNATVRGS